MGVGDHEFAHGKPMLITTCVENHTLIRSIKVQQNILSLMSRGDRSTEHMGTRSFASPSTSTQQDVEEPIPAPFVKTSPMAVQNAWLDKVFLIVTKLKTDAWEIALRDAGILAKFIDIPEGLKKGFFSGLGSFSLSCTLVPENHYTLKEDKELVLAKYGEEIALGRLSHGYDLIELFSLIGHFHMAPLAVIDQNGGKCHIIVNHSYARNRNSINLKLLLDASSKKVIISLMKTSINMIIDSNKFQCAWDSFSECYLFVADATKGTQAAVFNVESAFCNIPIHPSTHHFLAIIIRGKIHLDHVLNFSASPCPAIFGRVADAAVRIFLNQGVDTIIKWVNNFIFFHYPSQNVSDGSHEFKLLIIAYMVDSRGVGLALGSQKICGFF